MSTSQKPKHDPAVLRSLELLRHPDVLVTIRAELLRGGWPKHEIDDGESHVVTHLTEYVLAEQLVVEEVDRMQAIARKPAHDAGVDHKRFAGRRANLNARPEPGKGASGGPPPDPIAVAEATGTPVDKRVQLRAAAETLDKHTTEEERALAESLARGETRREYAERAGISHDAARKQAGELRSKYRRVLEAHGYKAAVGGGLVAGLFVLWLVFIHKPLIDEQGAKKDHLPPVPTAAPPAPSEEIPVSAAPPPITREQADQVASYLAKAHAAAHDLKWARCVAAYEAAMKIYPLAITSSDVEMGNYRWCQDAMNVAK